jgi:cysteine desulfurase
MSFFWPFFKQKRIYIDHAAATPLSPDVARVMKPWMTEKYANAGGTHTEGVEAKRALAASRKKIAEIFITTPHHVTYTSGGTESNNLALFGVVQTLHKQGRAYTDMEIVTTAIEHPSILAPLTELEKHGVTITYAPVDRDGRIIPAELRARMNSRVVLVTFAYANSEIGTVQDVKALSRIVRLFRSEKKSIYPLTHLDASQAPLWLPCRMDSLGVDVMTLDAGKSYGPKGSGLLLRRGAVPIAPIMFGGAQEAGLRPGTEDIAKIVGATRAFELAQGQYRERGEKVTILRDYFMTALARAFPTSVFNGSREHRLPNNINISIPHIDGEYAVIGLDHRGIACSTRSACKTNESLDLGGSHVLRALNLPPDVVLGAIRFSLGEDTTKRDLKKIVDALAEHVRITGVI